MLVIGSENEIEIDLNRFVIFKLYWVFVGFYLI